jgi:hypothetical protein
MPANCGVQAKDKFFVFKVAVAPEDSIHKLIRAVSSGQGSFSSLKAVPTIASIASFVAGWRLSKTPTTVAQDSGSSSELRIRSHSVDSASRKRSHSHPRNVRLGLPDRGSTQHGFIT